MKIIGKIIEEINMANKDDVYSVDLGNQVGVRRASDWEGRGVDGWEVIEIEDGEELELRWLNDYQSAVKFANEVVRNEDNCSITGYSHTRDLFYLPKQAKREAVKIAKSQKSREL